jgi:SAM-dependent methyltransferase
MKPNYGNWVPTKYIFIFSVIGLVFLGLSFLFPLAALIAIPFFAGSGYFAYAHYQFSPSGGNVQARILQLVVDRLDWNGKGDALDIGCGNAALTIKLALKNPNSTVTGIDYWGGEWEFSKSACEQNAACEGVADRVKFQKASASALPFENESFDAVVSNLVFHEVRDARDKRDVVKEALRVVKKGGAFAFQDLFLDKSLYGELDDLVATIKTWGFDRVEFVDTSHSDFIPRPLRLPFIIGAIGILYGRK